MYHKNVSFTSREKKISDPQSCLKGEGGMTHNKTEPTSKYFKNVLTEVVWKVGKKTDMIIPSISKLNFISALLTFLLYLLPGKIKVLEFFFL